MASPLSLIDNKNVYYLEIGVPSETKKQSLAVGITVIESDSEIDREENIWGYISFHDIISRHQRTISLQSRPQIQEGREIKCLSDTGESFDFSYVTKQIWEKNISHLLKLPGNVQETISETEAIQDYLRRL